MFNWIKKASAFVHDVFDKCMTIPDYNSRLVFLGTAIFTQIIIIWHTAKYLHSSTKDSNYPTILAILLGGHGVTAFGRFMTKRVGEKPEDPTDPISPTPPSPTPPATGPDGPKG